MNCGLLDTLSNYGGGVLGYHDNREIQLFISIYAPKIFVTWRRNVTAQTWNASWNRLCTQHTSENIAQNYDTLLAFRSQQKA